MNVFESARMVEMTLRAYHEALAALTSKAGGKLIVDIGGTAANGTLIMTVRDNVATFRVKKK